MAENSMSKSPQCLVAFDIRDAYLQKIFDFLTFNDEKRSK